MPYRSVAYASRTSNAAETNYLHFDKEALAIFFAVQTFHRRFCTDVASRSILIISHFWESSVAIPSMASAGMQSWILTMQAYEYDLNLRAGNYNINANCLSRLPQKMSLDEAPLPGEVIFLLERVSMTGLNVGCMRQLTKSRPILGRTPLWVQQRWPNHVPQLKPFLPAKG